VHVVFLGHPPQQSCTVLTLVRFAERGTCQRE
jgi:hypothetical protein